MLKRFLTLLILSGIASADDAIEVNKNRICVTSGQTLSIHQWDGKRIETLAIPLSRPGDPRPKFRNGHWWISNGKKIGKVIEKKIEWITLPDNLDGFSDFDVHDSNSVLIWAAQWRLEKGKIPQSMDPADFPFMALIDVNKGRVSKTYFAPTKSAFTSFFDAAKEYEGFSFKLEDTYVFVGKYSGNIRFFDTTKNQGWEIQCVDRANQPKDAEVGVNVGPCIPMVSPIEGGDLLLHVRWWLPKTERTPATHQDWFQILDPINKKLGEVQVSHRDRMPGNTRFWVDGSGKTHTLQ